jgi:hypothetical protein
MTGRGFDGLSERFCGADKPISRSILKADPRFEDATILKIARAGNPFPVTDEQWRAIISQLSD